MSALKSEGQLIVELVMQLMHDLRKEATAVYIDSKSWMLVRHYDQRHQYTNVISRSYKDREPLTFLGVPLYIVNLNTLDSNEVQHVRVY